MLNKKHGILWGGKSLLNTTLRPGEIFIKRQRGEEKKFALRGSKNWPHDAYFEVDSLE